MQDRILEFLSEIERENNCCVLFACESGSRAWGFASPNSDYDVRMIYTNPLAWHLRLEERRDTIEKLTPDQLDCSGWELGKTLRLFASCNLALNEWLDSPQVYRSEQAFHSGLRALIPSYFKPRKALHHYLSMAESCLDQGRGAEALSIKKACYVLRALAACQWILDHRTMPPTAFTRLRVGTLPAERDRDVDELLARKAQSQEDDRAPLPPALVDWIAEMRALSKSEAPNLPTSPPLDWEPLNAMMARWTISKQ